MIRSAGAAGLLTTVLTLLTAAPTARAELCFTARTDQNLNLRGPAAVAAGDFFDGDGRRDDLAITVSDANEIAILRNDGDGVFTVEHELEDPDPGGVTSWVGTAPSGIVVLDLNADSWDDIAGVNRQGSPRFFAYLNNTAGQVDPAPGADPWIAADDTADRGDGFDLVVTRWVNAGEPPDAIDDLVIASGNGAVSILQGSGGGLFVPALRFSPPIGFMVGFLTDVEVDRFDPTDPALLDVLTVDQTVGQLVIWPADPAFPGSLDVNRLVSIPTDVMGNRVHPFEAVVRDWNGDFFPDALVGTNEGYVLYYQHDQTAGVYGAPTVFDLAGPLGSDPAVRLPTEFTSMTLGRIDGDALDDLILGDAGTSATNEGFNWLSVYFACSDAPAPDFDIDGSTCGKPPIHHAAADLAPLRPFGVLAADLDMTPGQDILLVNGDERSITLFRNDGTGALDAAHSYSVGGRVARGADLGHLDADGSADLAVALLQDRTVTVLRGDGAGGLLPPDRQPEPGPAIPHAVSIASLNDQQDSANDVLVTFANEQILWPGVGDGTLAAPLTPGVPGEHAVGDLGGSSSLDLAVARGAGSVNLAIWRGDGMGGFSQLVEFGPFWGYQHHVTGRIFGSTAEDVVLIAREDSGATDPEGFWIVAHEAATDTYLDPVFLPYGDIDPLLDGIGLTLMAPSDLDRDGREDIVAGTNSGDALVFRSVPGGFSFDIAVTPPYSVGGSQLALILEDLNGDGAVELIAATRNSLTIREGLAGLRFDESGLLRLATNINNDTVRAGDLDGDGLPELVVTSAQTNDATVLRNCSTPPLILRLDGGAAPPEARWPDQGPGNTYDLMRGDLTLLRTEGDTRSATCLVEDGAATSFTDMDPLPMAPPGQTWTAFYYVVRCGGAACLDPTFGTDSQGTPRVSACLP